MTIIRTSSPSKARASRRRRRAGVAAAAVALAAPLVIAPGAGASPIGNLLGGGILEPADPVVEDVLVPSVFAPTGDALGPVVDAVPIGFLGRFPVQPVNIVWDTLFDVVDSASLQPMEYEYDITNWYANAISERGRAPVGVPHVISISNDVTADILVDVTDVTTTPTVRVIRLTGAPSLLPLDVSVTIAPNGWSSPERYRISMTGDTTDGDLPDLTKVTVTALGPNPQFTVKTLDGQHASVQVSQTAG